MGASAIDAIHAPDRARTVRRSLLLQLLLNHRTMQGPGYMFALLPEAANQPERGKLIRALAGFMNAHPIFALFAIGALRRKLDDAELNDSAEERQWKESLCGPLGVAGDELIWDRWKPIVFAVGAIAMLLFRTIEAWFVIAPVCLIAYNLPLRRARNVAYEKGYVYGQEVLAALGTVGISRYRARLNQIAFVVALVVVIVTLGSGSRSSPANIAAYAIAFATTWFGQRARFNIIMTLLLALTSALIVSSVLQS